MCLFYYLSCSSKYPCVSDILYLVSGKVMTELFELISNNNSSVCHIINLVPVVVTNSFLRNSYEQPINTYL